MSVPIHLNPSAGFDEVTADTIYLRLDCTNDPLTGELTTQAILPDTDLMWDLGTNTARYFHLHTAAVRSVAGSGILTATGVRADEASMIGVIDGATANASIATTNAFAAGLILGGAFEANAGGGIASLISTSGGRVIGDALVVASATGNATMEVSGSGVVFGRAFTTAGPRNCLIKSTQAGFAGGEASAVLGTAGSNEISALSVGAFAYGAVTSISGDGLLTATGSGAFATGFINGAATIRASGSGSQVTGSAVSATLDSVGEGSFVLGRGRSGTITTTAAGIGSLAIGDVQFGTISCSGSGSMALGNNIGTFAGITCSANNAIQLGIGVNALANSIQVQSGVSVRGTGQVAHLVDNFGSLYGAGGDAHIYYDGSDLIIDPDLIAAGDRVLIGATGDDDLQLSSLYTNSFSARVTAVVPAGSPYTALTTDHVIVCDTDTGAITVNLPTLTGNEGIVYHIKNTGTSGNAITVDPSGTQGINGGGASSTYTVTDGDSAMIVADENTPEWVVI